jgi:hypothetical protein
VAANPIVLFFGSLAAIISGVAFIGFFANEINPTLFDRHEYHIDPNFKRKIQRLVRKFKEAIKDYEQKETLVKQKDVTDIAQIILDKLHANRNLPRQEYMYSVEEIAEKLKGLSVEETLEFVRQYLRDAHLTV